MRVFDVFLNGKKLCRAGVGDDGVLSAIVSWVKLTGPAAANARRFKHPLEETRLHIGGLRGETHRSWEERMLSNGDRVTIELRDASNFDTPRSTKPRQKKPPRTRASTPSSEAKTEFLNVDLDLESPVPLDGLAKAFGRKVCVLYVGKERRRHTAHLELATRVADADRAIRRFVTLVDRLPRRQRAVWNGAFSREFNIGVQAGATPFDYILRLQPATIAAASRVNARIGMTVYAPPANSKARSKA